TVLVSNEVGQGLVPDSALGRTFRDAAGRMHQHMAALADEVYFAAVGMVVRLRPGPISACSPTEDSP
ncbi:MAG: adenosylcobinamide-phosphate guanylyltransferase, partial [Gammaproteobacteria bacterium]|nr:adenosylcobinamide-phosphate guanylyltransferase [Gammaproteobacteria bacterium]NIT64851.1 adenosylcobinamide-phosphate guanylyltransferase [Gammaproteobacteria bacterium]NIV20591.1 adenosylcobinamide-phosphate guanylyltransferase [Gammaproteobacteria bacterium]NIY33431.1 adenosylcobinamide-phosphate guanylyltransferase [Gammaproteobacteria bacterium]